MTDWLSMVAQTLLVTAGAFAAIALIASYRRFERLTEEARAARAETGDARVRFEALVADRIADRNRKGAPFTVALLKLNDGSETAATAPPAPEMTEQEIARLRRILRRTDEIIALSNGTVGLLIEAPAASRAKWLGRVVRELSVGEKNATGSVPYRPIAVGHASYPDDASRAVALIDIAERRLRESSQSVGLETVSSSSDWAAFLSGEQDLAAGAVAFSPKGDAGEGACTVGAFLDFAAFETAATKLVSLRRQEGLSTALLAVDIDQLKKYNQQYGRETGDRLLRDVGRLIQANARETDVVGRGEDDLFFVALACDGACAARVADRLLNVIRRAPLAGADLRATVTIGVAGSPEGGRTAADLMRAARVALNVGKAKGRNQVSVFQPEMRRLRPSAAPADVL